MIWLRKRNRSFAIIDSKLTFQKTFLLCLSSHKAEEGMENWHVIDRKQDCRQYLYSAAPPDTLDVGIPLSENVIGLVFHDKLQRLTLYNPMLAKKRHVWNNNREPRIRRFLRRKLITFQNLLQLRLNITSSFETYWFNFGRLFHLLPSLEDLCLIDYKTENIPGGLFYDTIMIPKKLKNLKLTTSFDPSLGAACFSRRISHCLGTRLLQFWPTLLDASSDFLIHFLRIVEKNHMLRQVKLKYPAVKAFLEEKLGEAGLTFLEGLTQFQLYPNCIVSIGSNPESEQ